MISPTLIPPGYFLPCGVVPSAGEPTSSAARKRRRDNINRGIVSDECVSARPRRSMATTTPDPITAARPVVTVRRTTAAKRPQLQYNPSVSMTREETSAWRAAQRRQRNSALVASRRKRERDRIAELEAEAAGWRIKFAAALGTLRDLDGAGAREVEAGLQGELAPFGALAMGAAAAAVASTAPKSNPEEEEERCLAPPHAPQATTFMSDGNPVEGRSLVISSYDRHGFDIIRSPVTSTTPVTSSENVNDLHFPTREEPLLLPSESTSPGAENRKHLQETRRVSAHPPLHNIESTCDDILRIVPDSCVALTARTAVPFPEACPAFVTAAAVAVTQTATAQMRNTATTHDARVKSERSRTVGMEELPLITMDGDGDDSDLDEFLLDAVQWL